MNTATIILDATSTIATLPRPWAKTTPLYVGRLAERLAHRDLVTLRGDVLASLSAIQHIGTLAGRGHTLVLWAAPRHRPILEALDLGLSAEEQQSWRQLVATHPEAIVLGSGVQLRAIPAHPRHLRVPVEPLFGLDERAMKAIERRLEKGARQ